MHCYFDDEKQAIDLARVLSMQPIGTHLYVCGPKGMIAWVLHNRRKHGLAQGRRSTTRNSLPPAPACPSPWNWRRHGKTITVGTTQSLLEAMEAAGVDAPYLCRGGACGQCETAVISADGTILHRDHWLTPEEHAAGARIMPCVSRFEGKIPRHRPIGVRP